MEKAIVNTSLGPVILKGDQSGLRSLQFTNHTPPPLSTPVPSPLEKATDQVEKYFNGSLKSFDLNLNLQGTPFQKAVWKELMEIPWGHRLTYMQLANKLKNPTAVRAVAAAIGKNPLLVVIPCHRVIGSNGSLTGYAAGLQRKQWLLEHEQANNQQRLF